ncbi:translocation and assembly module protein TamB [Sinirhodobacter populi]|uniref:Translocation and assembly module protein TamB n=1 Tax=Paenirhodobacter populi TaxID=2306993 RepID=A0A443KKN9_9RHOB|nr:translocation/assembly module TamB domain-containing protein [Sinirhodobacter populi]RWR33351.1 translocation and assembly module protein TamB [Sinirhodobacter populi]
MRKLALIAMLLLPLPVAAQDTSTPPQTQQAQEDETSRDRSYLTGLIEDNLSSKGRTIRLDGFRGALSSRATFDQLTIADDQGVWLTIRNGAMAWSRAAILTGRIEIRELSAAEIDLARLPVADEADAAPSPEATPFSLPELPVSVNIGTIKADRLAIGAPVLGEDLAFSLDGSMSLAGGEGKADIKVNRIDGTKGDFSFTGDFVNDTRQLTLDLLVDEGAGGIVSKKIGLPGNPALTLAVAGSGQLDDFSSDIVLSTDGQPRLSGKVTLGTRPAQLEGAAPDNTFAADLAGDVTPMLPEEYRAFFGNAATFVANGARSADGAISLSDLSVDAAAFSLKGALDLQASGLPEKFDLTTRLGLASGEPVLLPISGEQTWVQDGNIALTYDRAQSDRWTLDGVVNDIARTEMRLGQVVLSGSGTISQNPDAPAVDGNVRFAGQGIALTDPALADAVGTAVSGATGFSWSKGAPLRFTGLDLTGKDLTLAGDLSFDNLSEGIDLTAGLDLNARNLSNYARISGMPLSGAVAGRIDGTATLLTGAFDMAAHLTGQDIRIGQAQVDNILAGTARIDGSVLRDEKGLTIRQLTANARTLSAEVAGLLATGASDLTARVAISDMSVLGGGYRGTANLTASMKDQGDQRIYAANGTAANVAIGNATVDQLLAGNSTLAVEAAQQGDIFRLRNLSVQNPQVQVTAQGQDGGTGQNLTVSARLANAAMFAPNLSGPVTVNGTVNQSGNNYAVDLRGAGPGGTQATVSGTVAADGSTANLAIAGRTETALANAFIAPQSIEGPLTFDLRLNGAPGLNALSGRVATQNARMVIPSVGIVMQNINIGADLVQGRAQLGGSLALRDGGTITVNGPITLSGAYPADLRVVLNGAHLRDPSLYDTRISGALMVSGPLTGGALIAGGLTLDETEIRVPSGGMGGTAEIPDITHVHEGRTSLVTRTRAGLVGGDTQSSGGGGAGYRLNVTVDAPRAIFVRGRGLDAELGGSIRLTGTTNNIIPIGHFGLVRGRLDILAKRFDLTEGNVALQGAMVPWIQFAATTTQDDVSITLTLEGEATEPTLSITSSPELPEEEVLARLLFNKGLSNLSALQAAQLASSVASLAGKGGAGIMSRLRESFGLDDLDVGTDDAGNATVKAGKYLSDNVYTDVAIDGTGETTLNLNLDVTSNITARGSVGSAGDSGIGLFFEKDY